jgi:hypothetical protein
MRKGDNLKRRFLLFIALLMVISLLAAAHVHAETAFDLSVPGLRIGVATGTVQEEYVQEHYPQAKIFHLEKVDGCTAAFFAVLIRVD